MSLDRLAITNAALMEVGMLPTAYAIPDPSAPDGIGVVAPLGPLQAKAVRLALLATFGPDAMTRCDNCCPRSLNRPRCISVREALMGRTCGASS